MTRGSNGKQEKQLRIITLDARNDRVEKVGVSAEAQVAFCKETAIA